MNTSAFIDLSTVQQPDAVIEKNRLMYDYTKHHDTCVLCGRPMAKSSEHDAQYIHLVWGSEIAPAAQTDIEDASDCGWFPVGSECAKRIPKTHRTKFTNTEKESDMDTSNTNTNTTAAPKFCGCGCGTTVSSKRNFKPGHDARRKGQLLADLRSDDAGRYEAAKHAAQTLGWDWLIEQAKNKPAGKKPKSSTKSSTPDTPIYGTVKIGRWTYGLLRCEKRTDGKFDVAYTNRAGDVVTTIADSGMLS